MYTPLCCITQMIFLVKQLKKNLLMHRLAEASVPNEDTKYDHQLRINPRLNITEEKISFEQTWMKKIPELNPFSYFVKHHRARLKHKIVHLKSQSLKHNLHHSKLHLQGQSPTRIETYVVRLSILEDHHPFIFINLKRDII